MAARMITSSRSLIAHVANYELPTSSAIDLGARLSATVRGGAERHDIDMRPGGGVLPDQ